MLMLISPAKTLDYTTPPQISEYTQPAYLAQAAQLIAVLRDYSPAQIAELMHLSDELAQLNYTRYQSWQPDFTPANAKQAVLAFLGDVYEGLNAQAMSAAQLGYLSQHLRILSGLYGLLRPLDLMQPYRLEMGTRLANPAGKNLYEFWGLQLTEAVNALEQDTVVNLASDEYFKAIKPKQLQAQLITPVFEDFKGGQYKVISFYAKRARGLMVRYAAERGITEASALRQFDLEGYALAPEASTAERWVFRRQLAG
ncbi:peroxide stress protein YaaA [Chitinibacter tainanensis]|uniref:peroxide stress protein YaaA n=1 Tax=Chitinibacter tainanensis TaxID=230667 RepID=UPI002355733F|nr:peroxide stress protein YaaA [Chitinibacter tainanensis]